MAKKLTDTHPTQIKLNKLIDLAEELGISLEFDSGYCIVTDSERPGITFKIEDIEGDEGSVYNFPPCTETKTIIRGS